MAKRSSLFVQSKNGREIKFSKQLSYFDIIKHFLLLERLIDKLECFQSLYNICFVKLGNIGLRWKDMDKRCSLFIRITRDKYKESYNILDKGSYSQHIIFFVTYDGSKKLVYFVPGKPFQFILM
jgi:hypothetical protein